MGIPPASSPRHAAAPPPQQAWLHGSPRSPHAPEGPPLQRLPPAHRAIMASAVGLTVVPEQLPPLSEWCLDKSQGLLALDIADISNPQDAV